jgi:hypothetical protein
MSDSADCFLETRFVVAHTRKEDAPMVLLVEFHVKNNRQMKLFFFSAAKY